MIETANGQAPLPVLTDDDAVSRHIQEGEVEKAERQTRIWQWTNAGTIGLCLIMGVIIAILVSRSEILPWIVVVDPDMKVLYHGPAGSYQLKDLDIAKWLQEWIMWVRTKPGKDETPLQRQWWAKAIRMTTCNATKKLSAYFDEVHAEQEARGSQRTRVIVEVRTWERESSTRYRMTWLETHTPAYGTPVTLKMSGGFDVVLRTTPGPFGPKITAGDMNNSPLGNYVCDYHWSEQFEEVVTQ